MASIHWGRKETIIFPPHSAIYTYGAVLFAVILTGLFVYLRFTFGNTPLQRFYTPIYIRSSVAGSVSASRKDKYRLVMIGARGIQPRPATDADVADGNTPEPGTKPLPLALSKSALQAGYDLLYQDAERAYIDAPLSAYLKTAIYGGGSLFEIYQLPLFFGFLSLLIQLPFSIRKDIKRRRQMRYGRRLRGTERLTPQEFNRKVEGEGLGIKIDGQKEMLRIPAKAEAQHVQIIADTGGGKTTIIMQMLRQIRSRGDSAIVYDPALEYTRRFYDPKHDIILNPLDRRCPYWGPAEELRTSSEADAIAVSLFQPPQDKKGEFFFEIPQQIFAYLLRYGPTPEELIEWMSNPKEIDNRVARTEVANFIDASAPPQRVGVLASLSKGGKESSAPAAQGCWQRRVDRNRVVGNPPGLDLHHLASSRARGASSAAKRMDRHARAAPPERTESPPEGSMKLGKTLQAGQLVEHKPHPARPRIYAYSIHDKAHKGLLKIGQTTRDVGQRVAEQLKTAAIKNYKIELEESAERDDGTIFSDHDVRAALVKKKFENTELEWMHCSIRELKTVLTELRTGQRFTGTHHQRFPMRREQAEAVNRTHGYFHSIWKEDMHAVPRFLWNAKMRFGKTFTAYQLAKKLGAKRVLVLTFKPAVEDAWQTDLESHVDFDGWHYLSRNSNSDPTKIDDNKPVVYFGSFQDLLGRDATGNIKARNEWLHAVNWDLVVFDEYHFGAWRETAKELFEGEEEAVAKGS